MLLRRPFAWACFVQLQLTSLNPHSVLRRRVLLLEHSRSGFEPLGAYQDATADAVAATGKGCFWNQRVADMLPAAGLRVVTRRDALSGTLTFIEAERRDAPP